MAKLQILRAELADPPAPKLQILRAEFSGAAVTVPKLQVLRVELSGSAAAIVLPFPDQEVEPGSEVVIPGLIKDGVTPDTIQWRVVSGPAVQFYGTGSTRKFVAPGFAQAAVPVQGSIVIGVRAQTGSYISEATATITVLPEQRWARVPGGQWVPRTRLF